MSTTLNAPARADAPTSVPTSRLAATDVAAVVFPLLISLGANFEWAREQGDAITICAGVVAPLMLVAAVERWRRVPVGFDGWRLGVWVGAMAVIALVAAAWSWWHTMLLLRAHGVDFLLAGFAPLAPDGLAVMGILALPSTQPPSSAAVSSAPPRRSTPDVSPGASTSAPAPPPPKPPKPEPAGKPGPKPGGAPAVDDALLELVRAVLRDEPKISRRALAARVGCNESQARTALKLINIGEPARSLHAVGGSA